MPETWEDQDEVCIIQLDRDADDVLVTVCPRDGHDEGYTVALSPGQAEQVGAFLSAGYEEARKLRWADVVRFRDAADVLRTLEHAAQGALARVSPDRMDEPTVARMLHVDEPLARVLLGCLRVAGVADVSHDPDSGVRLWRWAAPA